MIPIMLPAPAGETCARSPGPDSCGTAAVRMLSARGAEYRCFAHAAEVLAANFCEYLCTPLSALTPEIVKSLTDFFRGWLSHKFENQAVLPARTSA